MARDGIDPAALAAVHAPAGLDIHAITPDEIALSILAQIVALRRSSDRRVAHGEG
jgi:xanthine dehydrogenase accessory factor